MAVVLMDLAHRPGTPRSILVDGGPEFISRVPDLRAYQNKVELDLSRTGKPTDNLLIELFNGWLRQEYLNQHWVVSPSDANRIVEVWPREYDRECPYRSLGNLAPE